MRVRDEQALARACDLGVAMQLTNIARDVGEDARAGRLYLPTDWMEEVGLSVDTLFNTQTSSPKVKKLTKRLLAEANRLYLRSEPGIGRLPLAARPGIFAARHCYDAIGRNLARNDHDNITMRATTTKRHKTALLGLSMLRAGWVSVVPESPVIFAKPLPETAFLVQAAAHPKPNAGDWSDQVISVLSQLKSHDHVTAAE
jgi:phytoene synthase